MNLLFRNIAADVILVLFLICFNPVQAVKKVDLKNQYDLVIREATFSWHFGGDSMPQYWSFCCGCGKNTL